MFVTPIIFLVVFHCNHVLLLRKLTSLIKLQKKKNWMKCKRHKNFPWLFHWESKIEIKIVKKGNKNSWTQMFFYYHTQRHQNSTVCGAHHKLQSQNYSSYDSILTFQGVFYKWCYRKYWTFQTPNCMITKAEDTPFANSVTWFMDDPFFSSIYVKFYHNFWFSNLWTTPNQILQFPRFFNYFKTLIQISEVTVTLRFVSQFLNSSDKI